MASPLLSLIWIYPIKSLDPVALDRVRITAAGALQNDRRWGIVNAQGQWVNGKREPRIHRLRAQFTLEAETIATVTLQAPEYPPATFDLQDDRRDLEEWLSLYFQEPVFLRENQNQGFPDDLNASGPTIVSEATLQTVSQWFPGMTLAETRLRFRANLELSAVPPFWEDQLFGIKGSDRPFTLGSVTFLGVNPCLRCVVPTRNPQSGAVYPQFVPHFIQQRRDNLPPWIRDPTHFENTYRLTVNTRIAECSQGHLLNLGDPLTLQYA
jgi:uncharacterized protein YcbX